MIKRHFKMFIFALFALMSWARGALAETPPNPKDEHFSSWLTYYYVEKDPTSVPDFIDWINDSQVLNSNADATPPIAAALATLFAANPKSVEGWLKSRTVSGATKACIEQALVMSGNRALAVKLYGKLTINPSNFPNSLLDLTATTPTHLDYMWGAFFVSGDARYVKKIIDILEPDSPRTGNKLWDEVTRKTAAWALSSNAKQHEAVRRIVESESGVRTGAVRTLLEGIVEKQKSYLAKFPARDGDFTAALFLLAESNLVEFDKPANEGPHLRPLSKAKRGDIVAAKLVFAGMALTEDLMGHVEFDLKVLDPSGKVFDNTDYKGALALRDRVPSLIYIFNNQEVVMLEFEPDDALGKYTFVATIHDKVGGKSLTLTQEIELTE